MADNTVNSNNPLGQDAIKGGIFFGSGLTPNGTFSNVPKSTATNLPTEKQEATISLTLEKVQEQLREEAKNISNSADNVLSDTAVNTFLQSFTKLLIDYKDMRNFVFFGSAYTELSYHVNFLINNYPYKSYFAKNVGVNALNPLNTVSLTYPGGSVTKVGLKLNDILEPGNLNYNTDGGTNWIDYDIVDKNNTRYPVTNFAYTNNSVSVTNFSQAGIGQPIVLTCTYTIFNGNPTPDPFTIVNGDIINLINSPISQLNATWEIDNFVPSPIVDTIVSLFPVVWRHDYFFTIELFNSNSITIVSGPTTGNFQLYDITLTIDGIVNTNSFVEYSPILGDTFKGFIISPKLLILNDFEVNLDPVQSELISLGNPTPWPRTPVVQNLIVEGNDFITWVENPLNMVYNYNEQELGIETTDTGLNLTGALALDENETNQLLRRAIPHRLVDEIRDSENAFFTRFVLLAGKLFDSIKVYIDFLKYTHELNYTSFNQLSPEYYKLYAEHYGFDLFDDDNIDFAQALIVTEPGLAYDSTDTPEFTDTINQKTIKELQEEKQKRLLINLLYLYNTKGTLRCIEALVGLLGSPQGLVLINEYVFDNPTKNKFIDNDKVKVPQIEYEIDPDYLVNKTNPTDPINQPYVYKLKLSNQDTVNLRELDIVTDPQGAIAEEIFKWGQIKNQFGNFKQNSFANLQSVNLPNNSLNNNYYFLPLTQPDKYSGVTVEYMIPKDGYTKGIGQGFDEVSIHLASIVRIQDLPNYPLTFPLAKFSNNFDYGVPHPFLENIPPGNEVRPKIPVSVASSISLSSGGQEAIFCRLEGKDLVVRALLRNEFLTGPVYKLVQRVAIFENLFEADGLVHELRVLYRPYGIEVYLDREFKGLIPWRDTILGYNSFDIPNSLITSCPEAPYEGFVFPSNVPNVPTPGNNDKPAWWDLFIGLPVNIDMYFKKVAIREQISVNTDDTVDFGVSKIGQDVEKYSFEFRNQIKNSTTNEYEKSIGYVPCNFRSPFPQPDSGNPNTTTINTFFASYPNNLITDMNLVSQNWLGYYYDKVTATDIYQGIDDFRFVEDIQDFFKLPTGETVTLDSLFKFNAWSESLHKDYFYIHYNKAIENYNIFSQQVLTYLNLIAFMELIESKFKPIVSQFIPVVINLSRFGRLIRSLELSKIRYPEIYNLCAGTQVGCNALASFRIISGNNNPGYSVTPNFITVTLSEYKTIVGLSYTALNTITINTASPHNLSNGQTIIVTGVLGITAANGSFLITVLTPTSFKYTAIGTGTWVTGSGTCRRDWASIGPVFWNSNNIVSATDFVTAFNNFIGITLSTPILPTTAMATNNNNVVTLSVNPEWYFSVEGIDINEVKLTITTVGDFVVDRVIGFVGGVATISGNSCATVGYINSTNIPGGNPNIFIYYFNEAQIPLYIYEESEVTGSGPYIYIY